MNNAIELKDWQARNGFVSPHNKVKIYYDPKAFAKTVQLVKYHPVEVGWNMDIRPYNDGYKVYDIYIYPQKVSAAYVSVDTGKWGMWKANLPDDVEANLNGNGHSHVNMSPFASIVDEKQQHNEILTKKNGFYFFQIWNKRNEINSFFYDIDNHIFYKKEDINMVIQDVDDFVINSFRMVSNGSQSIQMEVGEGFESE